MIGLLCHGKKKMKLQIVRSKFLSILLDIIIVLAIFGLLFSPFGLIALLFLIYLK